MKKIINSILFLFAITIFLTSNAFAAAPIPGITVVVKRNPGAIITKPTTDNNGKFSLALEEGKYDLTISYDEIINAVSEIDKNKNSGKVNYEITLMLDGGAGVMINNKAPAKLSITEKTGIISVSIPEGGATISGILTYEVKSSGSASTGTITITKLGKDATIDLDSKQPVTFSWKSSIKGPHTIKLFVVKEGQTPEEAMKNDKPGYQKEGITNGSVDIPTSKFGNEPGVKYLCVVSSGDVVGYSAITTTRSNIKHQDGGK